MKKLLLTVFSALLGLSLIGCETNETNPVQEPKSNQVIMTSIKGNIIYREKVALPPHAVVTITLEDTSLMDVAAKKIAEQTFTTDGAQVPFDFELSYDANKIEVKHRYSVRATIRLDGKLRFTTDTANLVITDEGQTKQVNLHLVAVN
jgi:putative lipoprotein